MRYLLRLLFALGCAALPARAQLSFAFDYSYDSAGFFSGENSYRRAYLEAAGAYLTSFVDATSVTAITPDATNSWAPVIFDPADYTQTIALGNISVAADTIVVYAGGTSFESPTTVAYGGPGAGSVPDGSSMEWISTLLYRGHVGYRMPPIGSITFTTDWAWYFDDDISTVEDMGTSLDFFSEAIHELSHLIGFGTTETWTGLVDSANGLFLGANAMAEFGGAVPLDDLQQHWAEGTMDYVAGTTVSHETAMDPTIYEGERKYLTDLDVAALADIGYTLSAVPEPATTTALLALVTLGYATLRRRRKRHSTAGS
ncbi:PEP-CTERM sorting domain-containing protein [Actomonas aquatica]|uniref:PEP-CTERM sorting domain-containing protein n=1 Tax=Actomonas aquatica TaxID=2866162 RepID=A0ABZ1C6X1_9BACT|nr:PEP-CTERM sorting domain-containing protein [Opitutus sp. WL0086]WRQ87261.1 PEP-CTERM sorting domain-containing protein [Opitutus sp. WL0086]